MTNIHPLTNNEIYAKTKGFEGKYVFCKEEDVRSAVEMLKNKINNKMNYDEGWRSLILSHIDQCFPAFKEEK